MRKTIVFLAVLLALTPAAALVLNNNAAANTQMFWIESKDSYQFAEMQFFTLKSRLPAWILTPVEGESAFRLFKWNGSEWAEIKPFGPLEEATFCIDGQFYEYNEPIPMKCKIVPGEGLTQHYYPLAWKYTEAFCGNTEYNALDAGLLEEGTYRVVFEVFRDSECSEQAATVMKKFEVYEGPA